MSFDGSVSALVVTGAGHHPQHRWPIVLGDEERPGGSLAVLAFYDAHDKMILEFLSGYYLDYQADGQWAAAVESGTDILDCYYDGEYHFLFGAADQEGETAAFEVFN